VYVRSILANNTVSSAEARRDDWDRLIRICLENREADIGAFVRRHLAGLDLGRLGELFKAAGGPYAKPTVLERTKEVLDAGQARFQSVVKDRAVRIPQLGYREAAILLDGEVPPHRATESLLLKLFLEKPRHSGWTPWVDSRGASEQDDRPYVFEG